MHDPDKLTPAEEAAHALEERKAAHRAEVKAGTPHAGQMMHRNDRCMPVGMQRVRTDVGGPSTPGPERTYQVIRAGYGEGKRAARARAAEATHG